LNGLSPEKRCKPRDEVRLTQVGDSGLETPGIAPRFESMVEGGGCSTMKPCVSYLGNTGVSLPFRRIYLWYPDEGFLVGQKF